MAGNGSLFDLSGRVAVVTGGNRGIGRAMALGLARAIQVDAIAPGWIETDMTAAVRNSPMNDEIIARTPAGRWWLFDLLAGLRPM